MSQKPVKFLFQIGKFLTLTPPFTQKVTLSQKLYSLIVATLITTLGVITILGRTRYQEFSHIKLTVNILIDCHLLVFNWYSVLCTVFWKKDKWQKMIRNILVIADKAPVKILRNTITAIIAIFFIFWTLICVYLFWLNTNGSSYMKQYNVQYIQYFQIFSYNVYLSFVLSLLLLEYQNIADTVFKLTRSKSITSDLFQCLEDIENSFCFLNDNVNLFNDIFGWPMALIISFTTLYLLNNFDYMFVNSSYYQDDVLTKILADAILVLTVFVGTVIVIIMCDLVLQQAEGIFIASQKLQRDVWPLVPEERFKMEKFCRTISENVPKFSASRFFWVDRSTILKILSTVIAFFIVMIQFRTCH